MDIDISDILASVTKDHPSTSHNESDLQRLTRSWVAERSSPELLPYPSDLMHRMTSRLSAQIIKIEDATGSMDPTQNFHLVVLQTELERIKFLLRSFLRARMAKVDAFPLHYMQDVDAQSCLSGEERQYLEAHQSLVSELYKAAFLGQLPVALQKLDDTAGGISMIETPDVDKAVFCRVLRDVGLVYVEGTDTRCDLNQGDVWVMRWSAIKEYVLRGDVELI